MFKATNADHNNGTERIYEASLNLGLNDNDVIINLQGDEPFTDPNDINKIFNLFQDDQVEMVSMFTEVSDKRDLVDPDKVKVVLKGSMAENFYRNETEPNDSSFIHLGIYGFKFRTLKKIVNLPRSKNEIEKRLEQMRAMDNDIPIQMIKSNAKIHLGIDTPADLKLANLFSLKMLNKNLKDFNSLKLEYSCDFFYEINDYEDIFHLSKKIRDENKKSFGFLERGLIL